MLDEPRLAFSFLSRLPFGGKGSVKNIARYFTAVGYGAGIIYWAGRSYVPGDLGVVLSIVVGFFLFDLFHFDGLLDTFDGFFNQAGREKCLEIMSKGDTGPFAIFFSFFYCLAFYLAFRSSIPISLLFMSVCGRFAMNMLLATTQPAKPGGLGALMSPYDHRATFFSAVLAAPLAVVSPVRWAVSMGVAVVIGLTMGLAARRKIGGYTGDVLGATCLLSQLCVLVAGLFVR
ncbi:MAG: adenosylcobinamide-GDP ribazoletransferase [Candidatus Cryosericum sp.]|jgi:adenosylcobinamide-GDP ribazoletransferase